MTDDDRRDLAGLLAQPAARRTLWRLISASGVYQLVGSASVEIANHSNGRRAFGLQLWDDCRAADPAMAAEMMVEALRAPRKDVNNADPD